ncbi:MAG: conserved membrane protein of unknown function [Candidatus Berkelbacteria bacterium Licking1014_7]|uniref:Uncharacterized protein n=1 Tax=Candidatus Berkelbacteria bacterium Licking1014_7 TaxID=2017147 RepID=A0A554LK32_9BACT|nr:MAG: conserved membrane protein of unknown function [Candidatus Berkelbacteria bacterium Licking1014_7]
MNIFPNKPEDLKLLDSVTIFITIANYILAASGIIAIIVIVVSGIKIMLSAGSDDQVASAKNSIKWAILGLIVIILATTIVNWAIFVIKK